MELNQTMEKRGASRKRRVVVVGAGAMIVLAIVAVAFCSGESQPSYKGQNLSWWMGISKPPGVTIMEKDYAEAVNAIGTNAIPFMLRHIGYQQPAWRKAVMRAYLRFPKCLYFHRVADGISGPDTGWAIHHFTTWFIILGSQGSPAIPDLIRIAQEPRVPVQSRLVALTWLRFIGKPARGTLPALQKLAADTNLSFDVTLTIHELNGTDDRATGFR